MTRDRGHHLVLLISTLAAVFVGNWLSSTPPVWAALKDSTHTLAFFFFALTAATLTHYYFYCKQPHLPVRIVLTLLAFCSLVGITVEIIQPSFGRQFSLLDWTYDIVGSGLGLLFHRFSGFKIRQGTCVLAMLIAIFIFPAYQLYALKRHEMLMPILFDFETHWQSLRLLEVENTEIAIGIDPAWPGNNSRVAQIMPRSGKHPGVALGLFPRDWSDYETFSLHLYSHNKEHSKLVLRINDAFHDQAYDDRFNTNLNLLPGLNEIHISLEEVKLAPTDRRMDMTQIKTIIIFSSQKEKITRFSIDNLTLN